MLHIALNFLHRNLTLREVTILIAIQELTKKTGVVEANTLFEALDSFSWDGGGSKQLLRNLRSIGYIDYKPNTRPMPITFTPAGAQLLKEAFCLAQQ